MTIDNRRAPELRENDQPSTPSKRRRDSVTESPTSKGRNVRHSPKPARRVSFEVDENDNVKTHIRKVRRSQDITTKKGTPLADRLWWSKEELDEIMEREQNVFEVFSKCCTSYVENILKVWEQCGDSGNPRPTILEMEKLANAPARGMENDVVVSFVSGSRQKAIDSVLKTQRSMANADFDARSTTMRRRYRHLSKAASQFARNIADGDAQVAAAILGQ